MSNEHRPTKRVLDIFKLLSQESHGINLSEISNKTKIPKSTISPILKTMVNMNFLKLENGLYSVGSAAFIVGNTYIRSTVGLDIIKSAMVDIVKECNEICQFGVLTDNGVLYLEKIEPSRSIKLESSIGKIYPAYSTALGKAMLTQYTADEIKERYKDGLKPLTSNTTKTVDELVDQIKKARLIGYATEYQETTEGVKCVSVPIESDDKVIGAISISMPFFRASEEKIEELADLLLSVKEKLRDELKGVPIEFI